MGFKSLQVIAAGLWMVFLTNGTSLGAGLDKAGAIAKVTLWEQQHPNQYYCLQTKVSESNEMQQCFAITEDSKGKDIKIKSGVVRDSGHVLWYTYKGTSGEYMAYFPGTGVAVTLLPEEMVDEIVSNCLSSTSSGIGTRDNTKEFSAYLPDTNGGFMLGQDVGAHGSPRRIDYVFNDDGQLREIRTPPSSGVNLTTVTTLTYLSFDRVEILQQISKEYSKLPDTPNSDLTFNKALHQALAMSAGRAAYTY